MTTIDLHTEHYLGELSIILQEKNNNQTLFKVILFDYHFNEILALIPLGQYHSDSIMSNYFQKNGWYEDEWECKRLQEFVNQLNAINNSIPIDLQNVYNAILQIFQSSINHNNKLFIELI